MNGQLEKLKPYAWILHLLAWTISTLLGGTAAMNYGRLSDRVEERTKDRYTFTMSVKDAGENRVEHTRLWNDLEKLSTRIRIQELKPIPPPEVEKRLVDYEARIRALEQILYRLDSTHPEIRK